MKIAILLAAAAGMSFAGQPVAASQPASASTAPDGRAWSAVVTKTDAGGYLMGNPDAPVKVVEYASLTCGHCAHFAAEGEAPLKADYVDSGRVSFELRNYTLNVVDTAASLLARCGDENQFFPMVDAMFARQGSWWSSKIPALRELVPQLQPLEPAEQLARIAEATGLKAIAAEQGLSKSAADACLADEAALDELAAIRASAMADHQVRGTPTFVIDGVTATDFNQWDGLKPALDRALGAAD